MGSLLESTRNTRTILKDDYRYVRSDVPDRITEKEAAWLLEKNITTIVDLRQEEEQKQKPCPLREWPGFRYHSMPVTGGNGVPESVDAVAQSYINMVDGQMERIVETIMKAESNVLYFCNAGKDRTGVVSAILLHRLGMSREYIVDDYVESAVNLEELLDAFARQFPEIKIEVITPKPRYMEEFLEWFGGRD